MRYMFRIGINFAPFYPSSEKLSQFLFYAHSRSFNLRVQKMGTTFLHMMDGPKDHVFHLMDGPKVHVFHLKDGL